MNTMVNNVTEVKTRVYELIDNGVDVDKVYDIIRSEFGETAVRLVPNCYFENSRDGELV